MYFHQAQVGHCKGKEGEQHGPDDGGQVGEFVQVGGIACLVGGLHRQHHQHPCGPSRLHQNHHAIEPCHDLVGGIVAPKVDQRHIDEREHQHPGHSVPIADPEDKHEEEDGGETHYYPFRVAHRQQEKADEGDCGGEGISRQTHQNGFEFRVGLGGGNAAGILEDLDVSDFAVQQQRHQCMAQLMDEGVDDVEELAHHGDAGQQKCRHQQVVEDVDA